MPPVRFSSSPSSSLSLSSPVGPAEPLSGLESAFGRGTSLWHLVLALIILGVAAVPLVWFGNWAKNKYPSLSFSLSSDSSQEERDFFRSLLSESRPGWGLVILRWLRGSPSAQPNSSQSGGS